MINMDDPRHLRLRSIVGKGFTPKVVSQIEEYVRQKADGIVDNLLERYPDGDCDFVEEVAAPLPLQIICEMMGIPDEDEKQIFAWTNTILGAGDPDYGGEFDALLNHSMAMNSYAMELGNDRLGQPQGGPDDGAHARRGRRRAAHERQEFGSFFILLVVAGNETTRNAISHGMKALTDFPDQRAIWWDDFGGVSRPRSRRSCAGRHPVIHFRRTATADTEIAGHPIAEGDKVVLWYNSANRDESKFADPYVFDVRRDPNPQVGYGAGGPHFCLGANLARREITVMFEEIHRRLPELRVTGEPAYLQSNFINGIKRMPCAWS